MGALVQTYINCYEYFTMEYPVQLRHPPNYRHPFVSGFNMKSTVHLLIQQELRQEHDIPHAQHR